MLIPALSVKQPLADRIAAGAKTIETRTWYTAYRGPLAICSSRLPRGQGPAGKAMCVVFLLDCRKMTAADERAAGCPLYEKAMAWVFHPNRIVLMPVAVRGSVGVFGLSMPEDAFVCPEDRALAVRWVEWARSQGFLGKVR